MRTLLRLGAAALGFVAVAGAAYALGPRVTADASVPPRPVPADLHRLGAVLAEREARLGDVVPGAEATVVWADTARTRRPLSVVYLHGFSATRQETAPLADTVAARLGAHLYYPRLTGHGRPGAALGAATATDWLRDARTALRVGARLGERVVLVGTSTGGTLALWLAAQPEAQSRVAAVVLVSPNVRPADPNAWLLQGPWAPHLARLALGPERTWTPANPAHARYWTERYPAGTLAEMMALVSLLEATDLRRLAAPTLALIDPADAVVSAAATRARLGTLDGVRIETVEGVEDPSHHVLAGRILSPRTTAPMADRITAFVRRAVADTTRGG
jgi:pimeloyl-ACP methyl ester carboxylesterase